MGRGNARARGGFRVEAPARASKGFTQGDGTQRLERMLQQVLLAHFRLECRAWQECVRVLYALMPSQTDESGLGAWLHMRLARLLEAQGHRGGVEEGCRLLAHARVGTFQAELAKLPGVTLGLVDDEGAVAQVFGLIEVRGVLFCQVSLQKPQCSRGGGRAGGGQRGANCARRGAMQARGGRRGSWEP